MKKRLILFAAAIITLSALFAFSACAPTPKNECDELGHDFGEAVEITAPTCSEEGTAEASCSRCGEKKQTKIPTVEHEPETIAGTPATCTKDGTTDKTVCKNCGEVITASTVIPKGHVLGDTYSVNIPRNENTGIVFFDCAGENCSYRFEYTLPKLSDSGYTVTVSGEDTTYTATIEGKPVSFTISNFVFAEDRDDFGYYYKLAKYNGSTANLTIPATFNGLPVRKIGNEVFKNNTSLVSVTLPAELTYIGASAFEGCTSLSTLTLPGSCRSIEENAFKGCTSLTAASLPVGMTHIYRNAFFGCTRLATVNLPAELQLIAESAFENCTSLTSVVISEGTTVRDAAFRGCTSLRTVAFNGWKYGNGQFEGCTALETLTVKSLTENLGYLFSYNFRQTDSASAVVPVSLKELTVGECEYITGLANLTGLQKVTLKSCKRIDGEAFKNCPSLTAVILSNNLESIDEGAFSGCTALNFNVYDGGNYLGSESNSNLALVGYVAAATGELNVKDGTKLISAYGDFWSRFTFYSIPNSIKTIEGYTSASGANVTFRGTPGEWTALTYYGYEDNPISKYCTLSFSDGKKSSEVTSLTLPEGTEHVFSYLFGDFKNLTSVILPTSVKTIQYNAFTKVGRDLKTVYYNGEHEDWYAIELANSNIFQSMEHVYFYNSEIEEYYEPTYIKLTGSLNNCNGFAKLEAMIIPKDKTSLSVSSFAHFAGCDLYFEGTATEWAAINGASDFDGEFNVYFFSEDEQTLESFLSNPVKLWHYTEDGAAEAWVKPSNTVDGKTYSYTETVVIITDEYWQALNYFDSTGELEEVLDPISLEMYRSSSTKEEYEAKLTNFSSLAGTDIKLVFSNGKLTATKNGGSLIADYIEANGRIYVKDGNKYKEYARIEDGKVIEDAETNQFITIEHIWVLSE